MKFMKLLAVHFLIVHLSKEFGRYSTNIVGSEVPLRIPIKCINYFPKPIPEDLLFSTPQRESLFWMWFYRKIQGARGCNPIDPDGAEGLKELLVKVNGGASDPPTIQPYSDTEKNPLIIPIEGPIEGKDHMVYSEDALRAWLMENIDNKNRKDLRTIFGPVEEIEWFANEIPYHVARRRIDILSIHKTSKYTSRP